MCCTLLVLIVALAAGHDAIEAWTIRHALASAFGGDAEIARISHDGEFTVLEGVRLNSPRGAVVVRAGRIAYVQRSDAWDVRPSGLHVDVAVGRLSGAETAIARDLAHAFGAERLRIQLEGSDATFARGDATLAMAGITGTIEAGERTTYDVHGTVDAGPRAYAFAAEAIADATGRVEQRWSAPALPLAPIVALLGRSDLRVSAGEAREVALIFTDGLRGTLTLAAVDADIAGHDVRGLAGPLTFAPDGLGSAGLAAQVDGATTLTATGEVHDGGDWTRILGAGTRDLRAFARMFALLAAQPNLHWMKLETTAPGITFGQYATTTAGLPHVVQLIAIDPSEPTVRIGTALAGDHIISTGARTSDLGLRTHAVAGVNGDYFDIGRTYEPQGLLMRDGVLLHGPTDHEAVVFDRDNRPTFARFRLSASVTDGERTYPVTLFNSWPTREVAIITPDYGKMLPAAPGITFAALEPLGGTRYRVTSLHAMKAPLPVQFGLGFSNLIHAPLPNVGDDLDLHYALDPPVDGAVAAIGSGPLLLKDGAWYEDRHAPAPDERDVRWPVVALGTMPDRTLMLVAVDGRHPERSIGMKRPEFAELLRGYGMRDAMALDSGGSVTMVSRAPGDSAITVRNVPSDFDAERYVSDALFVYSTAPLGTIVTKR